MNKGRVDPNKNKKMFKTWGVAQVVEHLPSLYDALSSVSTTKLKKKLM
jgi:hypothetical protein